MENFLTEDSTFIQFLIANRDISKLGSDSLEQEANLLRHIKYIKLHLRRHKKFTTIKKHYILRLIGLYEAYGSFVFVHNALPIEYKRLYMSAREDKPFRFNHQTISRRLRYLRQVIMNHYGHRSDRWSEM